MPGLQKFREGRATSIIADGRNKPDPEPEESLLLIFYTFLQNVEQEGAERWMQQLEYGEESILWL